MTVVWWQRVEAACLALFAVVALVALGHAWWWALALFLLYDVSMAGYAASPRLGALGYNAVHSWIGPAVSGGLAVLLAVSGDRAGWLEVVALTWAFHLGVDRALGYGLKHDDAFEHTHLGLIGRARRP